VRGAGICEYTAEHEGFLVLSVTCGISSAVRGGESNVFLMQSEFLSRLALADRYHFGGGLPFAYIHRILERQTVSAAVDKPAWAVVSRFNYVAPDLSLPWSAANPLQRRV